MTYSKLGTDTKDGQRVDIFKLSRLLGLYIIGLQGMGKSGLIEELILADIKQEIGVCVLDPHGELVDHVIARLPDDKLDKVVLLDLANYEYPFGLNLFECPRPDDDGEIIQVLYQVLHVFEKSYGIVPTTPLMYDLLYNTVYALIANPGYTMIDIRLLLTNEACRRKLVQQVPNPDVQDFWAIWDDPKQTPPEKREEKRATILNKMNDFLHSPLRNIIGQSSSTIHLPTIMEKGEILLVKLSRRLEQPSNLIGSILIAQLLNAAYARPTQKRKQFHLYADEFQNFATEDFATLLEEARKFGIGTTIAHQNRGQLNSANSQLEANLKDRSRSVGNLVVFKINSKDATDLAGEFKITPQPAWEEVLEEEWVEVLEEEWEEEIEKEWHERIEEIVDDGVEEIRVPKQDVLDDLLRHGHPNPDVMHFVNEYLRKVAAKAEEERRIEGSVENDVIGYRRHQRDLVYETFLAEFKEFLIEVLKTGDIAKPFPAELVFANRSRHSASIVAEVFDFGGRIWMAAADHPHQLIYGFGEMLALSNQDDAKRHASLPHYPRWKQLMERLWTSADGSFEGRKAEAIAIYRQIFIYQEEQNLARELEKHEGFAWGWEGREKYVKAYGPFSQPLSRTQTIELEHRWSRDEFEKTKQAILSSPEIVANHQAAEAFFMSLRRMLKALVAEPILAPTGQYQPRKRTQVHYLTHPRKTILHPRQTINHPRKTIQHPQRSYADVQAEIASELVNLPQYTARVKLSDGNGNTVEHTIQTFKPEKGLYGQALEARIESIRQRNITDGYLRDRATIEAEIRDRQAKCSQQGFSPPQAPPAARKAIPCSSCGFSNPIGSKFCNQCGTKL